MNREQFLVSVLIPVAYLVGSIPFGLIVGLSKGIDPRKAGSGNIGATNVGRLLGGRYFAAVFTLDMLKSLLPMVAAAWILRGDGHDRATYILWLAVGFGAIIGHMFPVYLGFKGGKGVATAAGVVLGLFPYYTLPAVGSIALWLLVFWVWRYVSLASIVAAVSLPVFFLAVALRCQWEPFGQRLPLLVFLVLVAGLVVVRHHSNISRLLAGTEHRFAKA
ncbi:MAG TPA: glycerol-3-phosphate 1-O-acyltransferase PlsY [Tepidisphaeraceae bacterium]|nr:glycerol-3-phosphate 1-O-acyltransferase PlsY [Tepidisphaeraceae bacterium]